MFKQDFSLNIVAKVKKGLRADYEYGRVAPGIWQPVRSYVDSGARAIGIPIVGHTEQRQYFYSVVPQRSADVYRGLSFDHLDKFWQDEIRDAEKRYDRELGTPVEP